MKKIGKIITILMILIVLMPNIVYGFSMDISANKEEINIGEEVIIQVKFSKNVPATHFYVKYDNTVFQFIEGINIPAAEKKNSRVACIYGDIEGIGTDTFYLKFKGIKASEGSDFIIEDENIYTQDNIDNSVLKEELEGNRKVTVKVIGAIVPDDTTSGGKLPQTGIKQGLYIYAGSAIVAIAIVVCIFIKKKKINKIIPMIIIGIVLSISLSGVVYAVQRIQEIEETYETVEIKLENTNEERYITIKELQEAKIDIQTQISEESIVKTGMKVQVQGEEKTIVQYGDGNGDGIICDSNDLMVIIKNHIGKKKAEGENKKATDLNKDGVLDQLDMNRIIKRFLGTITTNLVDDESTIKVIQGRKGNRNWYTSDIEVRITQRKENEEKVERLYYTLEGAQQQDKKEIKDGGTFILSTEGKTIIKAYEEYESGKIVQIGELEVKIDKTAPQVGGLILNKENENGEEYIEGNWAKTDIYMKLVNGKDEISGHESTTYEITGAMKIEGENTQPILINKEGQSTVKVTTKDIAGNVATKEYQIKISKTDTIAKISYSTTAPTNQNVIATIEFNKPNVTITNNNGLDEYTFTENGSFTFEYIDENGRKGTITAIVNNIDKRPPQATITYSTTQPTNQDVIATITFDKPNVTITNNNGLNEYTFTENGSFTFEFIDEAGNTGTATAEVEYINKNLPDIDNSFEMKEEGGETQKRYIPGTWTNKDVRFTLKPDTQEVTRTYEITGAHVEIAGSTKSVVITEEGISIVKITARDIYGNVVTKEYEVKIDKTAPEAGILIMKKENASGVDYINNTWVNKDVYIKPIDGTDELSGHKSTTYEIRGACTQPAGSTATGIIEGEGTSTITITTQDIAGNVSTREYIVKIDKQLPQATITYSTTQPTNQDVIATITFDKPNVTITNNNGLNEYTFTENGSFTFEFIDEAGNTGTATATVNIINKVPPTIGDGNVILKLENASGANYVQDTWTNKNVYVEIVNTQPDVELSYEVRGACIQGEGTKQPAILTNEGTSTIIVTARNSVGATATKDYIVKIDKTAPEAGTLIMKKVNVSGQDYINDTWSNQDVYIDLVNGTDALSGHYRTSYEVTGACSQEAGTMSPGLITGEGTSTVTVTTQDIAGNTSTREYIVKIQKSIRNVTVNIQFNKTSINIGESIQATITHTNNSEIELDLSKSKWVYTNSSSKIGTDANNYTGGYINNNPAVINTTMNQSGYYYLHVLTIDEIGNAKETVSKSITVKQPVTSLSLNKTSLIMDVGDKEELIPTILPSNAYNKHITWISSNEDIATVSYGGEITAKAIGTTIITAQMQENPQIKAICNVTVRAEDLASKVQPGDYIDYETSQDYTEGWQVISVDNGVIEIISSSGAQKIVMGSRGSSVEERTWIDNEKYLGTGWEGTLNFLNSQSRNFINTTYAQSARAPGTNKNNPNISTEADRDADKNTLLQAGVLAMPLEHSYFWAYTYSESRVNSSSRTVVKYYMWSTSSTPYFHPYTGEIQGWTPNSGRAEAYETTDGSLTAFSEHPGYLRPIIKLKSGIMTTGGDGTKDNPYKLFMK